MSVRPLGSAGGIWTAYKGKGAAFVLLGGLGGSCKRFSQSQAPELTITGNNPSSTTPRSKEGSFGNKAGGGIESFAGGGEVDLRI